MAVEDKNTPMGVMDKQKAFDESKPKTAPTWGNGYAIPQFQPQIQPEQPIQGPSTIENQQGTAPIMAQKQTGQPKTAVKLTTADPNTLVGTQTANSNNAFRNNVFQRPSTEGRAFSSEIGATGLSRNPNTVAPNGGNGNIVQPVQPNAQLGVKVPTLQQQAAQQPMDYRSFRDAMFGSEEDRRRKSNNKAKILAIGDALRHIGNLATTAYGHATPQKYATAPATEQVAKYEAEKKEKDAMGWQAMQYAQKQKAAELDRQLARDKMAQDQHNKDRDYELKVGDFKLKVAKEGREAAEAEQKLKNMTAQYNIYMAQGEKAKADAVKAQIDAEWEPKVKKAEVNQKNASAASSYASAEHSRASTRKVNAEIQKMQNGGDFEVLGDDGMYTISKKNAQPFVHKLQAIAEKKKGNGSSAFGTNGKVDEKELLRWAYNNTSDPEVKKVLDEYKTSVRPLTDADTDADFNIDNMAGESNFGFTPMWQQ